MEEIDLVEDSAAVRPGAILPPSASEQETVTLRFRLSADGERRLDALREARRSLLREEMTRGHDAEEPSLEDAVFSATEILWVVRPSQREWCVRKLEELRQRANRLLDLADPARTVPIPETP